MTDFVNQLVRWSWIAMSLVATVEVALGLRAARRGIQAVRSSGKNGVLLLITTNHLYRWLLRAGLTFVMLAISVLTFLAPQQPRCPGGVVPEPSSYGLAIVFGLLTMALFQVIIYGQDLFAVHSTDAFAMAEMDRARHDAPLDGSHG